MSSSFNIPLLLGGMILTGSSNSLWGKFQDMQCVENCADPDYSKRILYEQPVWQTLQMFVGEMLCFLPVLCIRLKSLRRLQPIQLADDDLDHAVKSDASKDMAGWHVFLFWIPAFCDLIATTLMNIGLIYTPVSIYQMTRGALVLFVGVFSVIFLHHRLRLYQWISLLIVVGGVGLVGSSGSLVSEIIEAPTFHSMINHLVDGPSNERQLGVVLVGVSLILFAQVFAAIQFVAEEKIMERYSVTPLVAVGYEGLFGTISIMLCIPILSIPSISKLSPFFDLSRGWHQSVDNSTVLYSGIATAISIAFFNFFGLSVTRHVSATARSLTDTCRTLSIWIISLGLGWEIFLFPASLLQVLGFSLLV
ncbi:Transmembrane protein C2orf18 [Termitomyces sp. J132]|nr:Transmembrane protein C2orf18 [Termitomyces sp. J132]